MLRLQLSVARVVRVVRLCTRVHRGRRRSRSRLLRLKHASRRHRRGRGRGFKLLFGVRILVGRLSRRRRLVVDLPGMSEAEGAGKQGQQEGDKPAMAVEAGEQGD